MRNNFEESHSRLLDKMNVLSTKYTLKYDFPIAIYQSLNNALQITLSLKNQN